jgi:RNase_H superfamily
VSTPAKILFIDIETAPSLGWVWQKWEANVIDFKSDWYLLSFAYKWSDDKKVTVLGLDDAPKYKKGSEDDKWLSKKLWDLLDEADIVIGHNSDQFDLPKINTRFLTHGLNPPAPYKTVDTLKIARKIFKFDSNKLDDLARYLKIGRKLPTTGFHTWRGCMTGDPQAWKLMKQYNAHDVELLESLYSLIRMWHPTHPNVNMGEEACPTCSSKNVQRRGFSYTLLRKKQRFQCLNCRRWYEGSAKKV